MYETKIWHVSVAYDPDLDDGTEIQTSCRNWSNFDDVIILKTIKA